MIKIKEIKSVYLGVIGVVVVGLLSIYFFGGFKSEKKKKRPPRVEMKAAVVIGNVNISNYAIITCRKTITDSIVINEDDKRVVQTDTTYELLLEAIVIDTATKKPLLSKVTGRDSSYFQFVKYPKRMIVGEYDLPTN